MTERFDLDKIQEIPFENELYPSEWKTLSDPPSTLYAYGNISLLKRRKFAIVGSRRTPANAMKLGAEIAGELSQTFVIVTGTADGGDSAAIEGTLVGSGEVICVLAGGFSAMPQGSLSLILKAAKKGLLLSPYPFDVPVRSFSYEYRNKLLAALSEGVLILSAGEKSGALITAKYAERQNKPVFAFPYPPNSLAGVGCNALLKKGAYLTENSVDISERFGINLIKKKRVALTADEEKIYETLRELSEGHIEEISKTSGVPIYKARAVLSALEVKGLTVSLGGNRYTTV